MITICIKPKLLLTPSPFCSLFQSLPVPAAMQKKTVMERPHWRKFPLDEAILAFFFCLSLSLFLLQFHQIFLQYHRKATSTAITYEKQDYLLLPDITICPQVPFKEHRIVFYEEDYVQKAWSFDDIFDSEKVRFTFDSLNCSVL